MAISFYPKNKEIEHIFDRLVKYPVVRVNPILAQTVSRYKKIRFINQDKKHKKIYINGGIIGLSPKVKLKKNGDGFLFEFK